MPATQSTEDLLGLYKGEIHRSSAGRTTAGKSAGATVIELGITLCGAESSLATPGRCLRCRGSQDPAEVHVAIPESLLLGTLRAGVHSHSARFAHVGRLHPHARAAGNSPRASPGNCCCTTRKNGVAMASKQLKHMAQLDVSILGTRCRNSSEKHIQSSGSRRTVRLSRT
jgi:hypothetical protein